MRPVYATEKSMSFPYKILATYFTVDETERVKGLLQAYTRRWHKFKTESSDIFSNSLSITSCSLFGYLNFCRYG